MTEATWTDRVRSRAALMLGWGLFAIVAAGCKAKIGDACATSTDCSQTGDRLCDTSQPGGYCTIFNCEPDACPTDESVCVAFYPQVCGNPVQSPRWERSFCMRTCDSDGDCRAGYACLSADDAPGVAIIDTEPSGSRFCMAPPVAPPASPPDGGAGCSAVDASFPPIDASAGDADASLDGDASDAGDEDAPDDAADEGDAADDGEAGDAPAD